MGCITGDPGLIWNSSSCESLRYTSSKLLSYPPACAGGGLALERLPSAGGVSNNGTILAREGDVMLIGRSVGNTGDIYAPGGTASLLPRCALSLRSLPVCGERPRRRRRE